MGCRRRRCPRARGIMSHASSPSRSNSVRDSAALHPSSRSSSARTTTHRRFVSRTSPNPSPPAPQPAPGLRRLRSLVLSLRVGSDAAQRGVVRTPCAPFPLCGSGSSSRSGSGQRVSPAWALGISCVASGALVSLRESPRERGRGPLPRRRQASVLISCSVSAVSAATVAAFRTAARMGGMGVTSVLGWNLRGRDPAVCSIALGLADGNNRCGPTAP